MEELRKSQIKDFNYKDSDVVAFAYASPDAMGFPDSVVAITKGKEFTVFGSGEYDYMKLDAFFRKQNEGAGIVEEVRIRDNKLILFGSEGWGWIQTYLGCGNNLYIREYFRDIFKKLAEQRLSQDDVILYEVWAEIMKNVISNSNLL